MKTKYKFIHFEKRARIDREWLVKNNKSLMTLGVIEWYQPWKQYCFCPFQNTVFNDTCLADIQHFIGQLSEGKP